LANSPDYTYKQPSSKHKYTGPKAIPHSKLVTLYLFMLEMEKYI